LLLHSSEQHLVSSEDKLKVLGFDLLASAVGCAESGVVAGFDYEVCENFVECRDGVWERWRVVAEGYEEGGDWDAVRVGFLKWWEWFLRSSELKTWPFWRTRARGSAIFGSCVEVVGVCG
jgi:hypothetical protein